MIRNRPSQFAALPVERACALFDLDRLDRSGYYRQPRIGQHPDEDETLLRDAIENIVAEFAGYGYRRVTAQLARDGWSVNHIRDAAGVGSGCFGSCAKTRCCVS